jgi:hypothetical protein
VCVRKRGAGGEYNNIQCIFCSYFFFHVLILAVDFNQSLTQLEALQQQIVSSLQNNDTVMKDVQRNFKLNLDAIVKNMSSLETRIAALKKN